MRNIGSGFSDDAHNGTDLSKSSPFGSPSGRMAVAGLDAYYPIRETDVERTIELMP
jgi:hypothetical protein